MRLQHRRLHAAATAQQLRAASSPPSPPRRRTRSPAVDVRVFLGVLTVPGAYERGAHLRLAYSLQPRPVLCNLYREEEDRALVAMEIVAHGDVLVLDNCTETMDADAKTHAYFSAVARMFAAANDELPSYDFVVGKTDDDDTHYYRLAALADALRDKPRDGMYHGLLTTSPCHGMGYVVSWDMAEWISTTAADEAIWKKDQGWEDKGIRKADRETPAEAEVNCFRHEHVADTVAVHKLKDRLKWARTLFFFNGAQALQNL